MPISRSEEAPAPVVPALTPKRQQPSGFITAGEDAIRDGDKFIHDRDVQWLELADVVIAEVTQPSLGVGYELGRAVAMKKKVLCLFRPSSGRCLSAMVRGAEDGKRFFVKDYQEEDIEKLLEEYFRTTFPGSLVMQPGKDAC